MATVSSFEGLEHPTKSELRQFAELFSPLFQASTDEAKRQAVAALSQSPQVPRPVAAFIASQPIAIAAPFLTSSPCLDDDLLIMVARSQGAAHAHVIATRPSLSPTVVDALAGLRHDVTHAPARPSARGNEERKPATGQPAGRQTAPQTTAEQTPAETLSRAPVVRSAQPAPVRPRPEPRPPLSPVLTQPAATSATMTAAKAEAAPQGAVEERIAAAQIRSEGRSAFRGDALPQETLPPETLTPEAVEAGQAQAQAQAQAQDQDQDQATREESLRETIRRLAQQISRPSEDRLGLRSLTPVQEALLVRFARGREAHHFATTLADALSASRWLAERIMLDISGRQLAVTLTGLGMGLADASTVLCMLYPHLARETSGLIRAESLLAELDPMECHDRIEAWRRADSYTWQGDMGQGDMGQADMQGQEAKAALPPAPRPAIRARAAQGRRGR